MVRYVLHCSGWRGYVIICDGSLIFAQHEFLKSFESPENRLEGGILCAVITSAWSEEEERFLLMGDFSFGRLPP